MVILAAIEGYSLTGGISFGSPRFVDTDPHGDWRETVKY